MGDDYLDSDGSPRITLIGQTIIGGLLLAILEGILGVFATIARGIESGLRAVESWIEGLLLDILSILPDALDIAVDNYIGFSGYLGPLAIVVSALLAGIMSAVVSRRLSYEIDRWSP